ncbi:MAG: PLP-dependent aminotransferase family protein [Bdellovibrionales bacterium]
MTNNPYRLGWIPVLTEGKRNVSFAIAQALADDIKTGRLKAGERLPPQRLLAYTLGLNPGTVHKAYKLATAKGLITGEVGRGSFVKSSAEKNLSWPNENPYERTIDFCDNYPCPVRNPAAIRKRLAELSASPLLQQLLQYQQNSALMNHKVTGASWLSRFGIRTEPENVIIASGALHAGFISLLTLSRPGDLILTEEFTSQAIKGAASRLKLRLKGIKMDGHGIIPEHLEELLKKERVSLAYLVPTLHNPTATLLPLARRKKVAALLAKYGVPLIEDDIFAPLLETPLPPISSFLPESSFYIAGLSKAVAPALRLAFLKVPKKFYHETMGNLRITTWLASPLLMELAAKLISCGDADRLIKEQKAEIRKRHEMLKETFRGFDCSSHADALHAWVALPEPWRAASFRDVLAKKEVLVLSADSFAAERSNSTHAIRICLGTPPQRAKVAEGLQIIRDSLIN